MYCYYRHCTHLLSLPIQPDTLHATMRLLLSLTRTPILAKVFMAERGPHALLSLTQQSHFNGFTSLSSLLIRHILEDQPLLEQCIDTIIRSIINGGVNDAKEFKAHGPGRRDFDVVLRKLSPCICRERELFIKTAAETLKLTSEPPPPKDYLAASRIHPILLKYAPLPKKEPLLLSSLQTSLLTLLVDHLCNAGFIEDGLASQNATPVSKIDEDTSDSTVLGLRYRLQGSQVRRSSYRRQVTDNDDDDEVRSEDMVLDVEPVIETRQTSRFANQPEDTSLEQDMKMSQDGDGASDQESDKSKQSSLPLFTQAAVLRLLAEIIESYPVCAKTIIESTREIKYSSSMKTSKVIIMIALYMYM